MALTFDGPNRNIVLSLGTVELDVRDLWSRWVDWFQQGDNSKYPPAMRNLGGDVIDAVAGTYVPVYVFLQNGWTVSPQEADHTLAVTNGILIGDGGGDPFNNTVGDFVVRVNYQQPVQAISFAAEGGGGGGLTISQDAALTSVLERVTELWQLAGLDAANPMTVTPNSRVAGNINLAISGDGQTSSTVTRQ